MDIDNDIDNNPKPTDIVDGEKHYKRGITIKNNLNLDIEILRLESDWDFINFMIDTKQKLNMRYTHNLPKYVPFATLYPGDKLEITFNEPEQIKP